MLCPNCSEELEEVKIPSYSGVIIKTNQCRNCGGVWFNNLDLFSLTGNEARILEEISRNKPKDGHFESERDKLCPVCGTSLVRLKDPNIPQNINIDNCPRCNGLWMNRGETIKYKEYQEQKAKQQPGQKTKEEPPQQGKKESINMSAARGSERDQALQETEEIIKSLEKK